MTTYEEAMAKHIAEATHILVHPPDCECQDRDDDPPRTGRDAALDR
jgi:hypothetical protein